uniref:Uncharacterized protein n=1 Tax=Neogobius melanostomus TaxID=47308 RepID=A0A8C6UN68_9GOBI
LLALEGNLLYMFFVVSGNQETDHDTQERREDPDSTHTGDEPGTFLLQSERMNHCNPISISTIHVISQAEVKAVCHSKLITHYTY